MRAKRGQTCCSVTGFFVVIVVLRIRNHFRIALCLLLQSTQTLKNSSSIKRNAEQACRQWMTELTNQLEHTTVLSFHNKSADV